MKKIILLCFCLLMSSCVSVLKKSANQTVVFELLESGLCQTVTLDNMDLPTEETRGCAIIDLNRIEWSEAPEFISIKKKLNFGFLYKVTAPSSMYSVKYIRRISHPLMKLPDGHISKGYQWEQELELIDGAQTELISYSLNKEYEMLTGEWTLEIIFNGEVQISKTFNIIDQEQALVE